MPKEKKVKETDVENDILSTDESAVDSDDSEAKENLGSPTYEELVDINAVSYTHLTLPTKA